MKILLTIILSIIFVWVIARKLFMSDLSKKVDERYHYGNLWEPEYRKSLLIFLGVTTYVVLFVVSILEIVFFYVKV